MLREKTLAVLTATTIGTLLALSGPAMADTVVSTTPANNQANLSADAGQTFTTGTLSDTTLNRIQIEGPQTAAGPLGPFTLELYTDTDGDHGTWDPGTLLGSSTSATLIAGAASLTSFDFLSLPTLSSNTVYAFTYTDGAGSRVTARTGLTNATAISNGTLFSGGAQAFGDAFDTAMVISTGGLLGSVDLTIDRGTGNMTLTNTTTTGIANIIGYSILSDAGALSQTSWDQQAVGASQLANDNDTWTVLTESGSNTDLSESVLTTSGAGDGGDLVASTGSWNFGNVWQKSHLEDVAMEILLDDGSVLNSGEDFNINYSGTAIDPADLNSDGTVNAADWVAFKQAYGTDVTGMNDYDAYHNGDINLDGVADFEDFQEYRALSAAAPFATALASVPEPSSLLLMSMAGIVAITRRTRRKSFMLPANFLCPVGRLTAVLAVVSLSLLTFQNLATADTVVNTLPANNQANLAADAAQTFTTGILTEAGLGSIEIEAPQAVSSEFLGPFTLELYTDTDGDHGTWDPGTLVATSTEGTFVAGAGNITTFNFGGETLSNNTVYGFTYTDGLGTRIGARTGLTDASAIANGTLFSGGAQVFGNAFDTAMRITTGAPIARGINVNIDTGSVTMFGHPDPLEVTGYTLKSSLGQLVPGNLNSLESQGIGDPAMTPNDGIGFEVLGTPDAMEIAEGDQTGFTVFDDNTSYSLGNIFNTSTPAANRDLEILFSTTGSPFVGSVNYVTGGPLTGDYDASGLVGQGDLDLVLLNWGQNSPPVPGGWINDQPSGLIGQTSLDKVLLNWGSTALTSNVSAVPEPNTILLVLFGGILVCGSSLRHNRRQRASATNVVFTRRRLAVVALAPSAGTMLLVATAFATQNDRDYTLGDDSAEGASAGGTVGSAVGGATFDSAGTVGAGDLQDLSVNGSPTYVNVSTRPGAGGSDLGVNFNGTNQSLSTLQSLNAPTQFWDNANFFPGPAPAIFPHNYEGIFNHGMQLWAKPDSPGGTENLQQLIQDTNQHGIYITDTGNWGYQFRAGRSDSGVSVNSTLDGNGWAHVFEMSGANVGGGGNAIDGSSAFGGAVLVNGVAVVARDTFYDPSSQSLAIGAGCVDGDCAANGGQDFYDGVLDDVRLFFWGDNSDSLGADEAVGGANTATNMLNADGQNWGALNLNVDNDWIAQRLASLATSAGVGSIPDSDLDFDGDTDGADEAIFISNWRDVNTVGGVRVGDWNSRQKGDFNYDGLVDLADAFIIHDALAPLGGLNFASLGVVPEPSTCLMMLTSIVAMVGRRRHHA